MGKLVRLELYNFKSYKGHHVLLFGDSYFTSIIGPNGSGKSNSMDAISFVLGIKSSHLRSSQLKDLVYRGRVYRTSKINADGTATEAGAEENGNGAQDDDTQQSTHQDQVKGAWVMAVYEDDAGDEQKWKRTITNSGTSDYRVNDRSVTAKQYNEILERENILVKARNFLVFQGDVEAIAQQSPKDLTRLIEQISGSLEYKEEYDRLKLEAEKANEDQSFKLNQRRAMNSEIKQYQDQKKEAEAYDRKIAERDDAIVTHVLWKLFHFQKTIEESEEDIKKHKNDLQEFERSVAKYKQRLEDSQRDQAKASREVSKVQRNIERKEKEIDEKENSLVPVDEKIAISNQNIKRYQDRITDITKEQTSQTQQVERIKKDISTVEKAQSRWEEDFQRTQQQQGRQLSATDFQEYNRLRGDVTRRTGQDQTALDSVSRQVRTDEETVNSLRSRVSSTESEVEKLNENISSIKDLQSNFDGQAKSAQKDIDRDKKQINALSSERVKSRRARDEIEEKMQQAMTKLIEADDGRRTSEREQRARELVNELKRLFGNAVLGRVHELCKPKQKKFETAVGVVLGRHLDSIVTESEKVASECIQYLKDKRVAPTTFLPLDTIQVSAINPNLKGMHRGMRLAVDTVDYDNSVERAMNYVCGNSIVCDTIDVAKYLCYEKGVDASAVTLDGTKFSKGGVLTGGQNAHDKPKRWDDTEVEALRKVVDKCRNDLTNLKAMETQRREVEEEEKLRADLAGAESRLQYAKEELKSLARNLDSKKKEVQFKSSQLDELRPRYEEQRSRLENFKSTMQEHRDAISEVEDEVFAEFCQRLGYEDIREYEDQQGSVQEEALRERDAFTKQKTRLQSQLEFETKRLQATADRITKLKDQARRDEQAVAALETEKDTIQSEVDALNAELEQFSEMLETANEKANEAGTKVTEHRRDLAKRSKHVDEKQGQVAELTATVQRTAASRFALFRRCRLDDIKIPLTQDSEPLNKLPLNELAKDDEDEDAMDVDDQDTTPQIQDYGIEVDFDGLTDDLKEDDSPQASEALDEKIAEIASALEKMAPNARANDRLASVTSRAHQTDTELNDSRKSATKAKNAFDKVKEKRLDLFRKAFTHISEQIDPVYKDLTRGLASHMGGQAYLDEEEADEPYLAGIKYHAMPPLKRFRDMEHLSGGEKTMAALALLFAVHSYQPSPFFVLDEVDAALDNANVGKLLGYIKRNARPGMQFIVISLKSGLFEGSETLVGVMRDQGVNSSKALTLDLRKYQA